MMPSTSLTVTKETLIYARLTINAAVGAGADFIVLCDTNGGTLPGEILE